MGGALLDRIVLESGALTKASDVIARTNADRVSLVSASAARDQRWTPSRLYGIDDSFFDHELYAGGWGGGEEPILKLWKRS